MYIVDFFQLYGSKLVHVPYTCAVVELLRVDIARGTDALTSLSCLIVNTHTLTLTVLAEGTTIIINYRQTDKHA